MSLKGYGGVEERTYPCSCKALMACARLTCACSMTSLMSSSLTSGKEKQGCEMEVREQAAAA